MHERSRVQFPVDPSENSWNLIKHSLMPVHGGILAYQSVSPTKNIHINTDTASARGYPFLLSVLVLKSVPLHYLCQVQALFRAVYLAQSYSTRLDSDARRSWQRREVQGSIPGASKPNFWECDKTFPDASARWNTCLKCFTNEKHS